MMMDYLLGVSLCANAILMMMVAILLLKGGSGLLDDADAESSETAGKYTGTQGDKKNGGKGGASGNDAQSKGSETETTDDADSGWTYDVEDAHLNDPPMYSEDEPDTDADTEVPGNYYEGLEQSRRKINESSSSQWIRFGYDPYQDAYAWIVYTDGFKAFDTYQWAKLRKVLFDTVPSPRQLDQVNAWHEIRNQPRIEMQSNPVEGGLIEYDVIRIIAIDGGRYNYDIFVTNDKAIAKMVMSYWQYQSHTIVAFQTDKRGLVNAGDAIVSNVPYHDYSQQSKALASTGGNN